MSMSFTEQYVQSKVCKWVREVQLLATSALSQPYATYATFTHALIGR